jgi:DNA-binding winged helix-turn-helix (wHTH) protein
MRVNSTVTGFFNNRLVIRSCSGIVMLAIFFLASSFTKRSDDLRTKQVNLIIRDIGHRLLLQAGDPTSRVLPVTEINKGTFLLRFENEFAFSHDSLMMLSRELLPESQFPLGYTVTVHDCIKADIVYGFQLNNLTPDILACRGRSSPLGCYTIEFTFPDLSKIGEAENAEEKKYAVAEPKKREQKAEVKQVTEEPSSFKVDSQTFDTKLADTQEDKSIPAIGTEASKASGFPLTDLVYSSMLVLLGVTLLVGRFGKVITPLPMQNQKHTISKESLTELPSLGKFLFDVKGQRLLLGSEVITLTDKECQILELLRTDFGELIPRETLMQKVWIDEGVITGRSLDMFVSKLRKKLSGDPELRITNVHGKGYKLEIPETGIL